MADETDDAEKTEDPSQKKLDEAFKRGDVAKSQEVSSWFVLFGSTLALGLFADSASVGLADKLSKLMMFAYDIPAESNRMVILLRDLGLAVVSVVALPFLILIAAAITGNLIQHRLVWSFEPVTPKLSKISPISGFKRIFSKESLVNFVKGLAKIVLISLLMVAVLWPERDRLDGIVTAPVSALLSQVKFLSLKLLGAVVIVMALVALLDLAWQKHRWFQKQKMSLKELKDEFKQMEGDPKVKAKIHQIRSERSRKRMMAEVPKASVVITNPTHYAVALKYEKGMSAPICVAKGIETTALRIRSLASEHAVPVVENPSLARALHASVNLDEEVPPEHYKAVAQVIGYVMGLRQRAGWRASTNTEPNR